MHWLFSFKYWVISREVPKLFESKQISFKEGSYRMINTIGCLVNIVPCLLIAYFRGKLTVDSANMNTPSVALINTLQGLYFCCTALQLVSGIVLADALRRIMTALKENRHL